MPERGAGRDAGAAGGLADADRIGAALANQLQRGVDQHPPEIAMVIRLRRGCAGGPAARTGDGRFGSGGFGRTHAVFFLLSMIFPENRYPLFRIMLPPTITPL